MGRNFDRYQDRYERVRQRLARADQNGRFRVFHELRRRLYRSREGKVLGVFRGIAESMGFCVRWTRIIGCFILLTLAGFFGAHGLMVTLLVGGFFYLLAALLMQAPRDRGSIPATANDSWTGGPPPIPRGPYEQTYPVQGSYRDSRPRPGVNLAQLDQQLERLNQRIQHMETIVTDRQFDWNRRMES